MSPFRLFGRRDRPADDGPDPWLDDPVPDGRAPAHPGGPPDVPPRAGREHHDAPPGPGGWGPAGAPGPGVPPGTAADGAAGAQRTGHVPDGGAATAASRPTMWTVPRPQAAEPPEPDPVTDPFGFSPIAEDDVASAWAAWTPPGGAGAAESVPHNGAAGGAPDPASPPARGPAPDPPPGAGPEPDRLPGTGPRRWTIGEPGGHRTPPTVDRGGGGPGTPTDHAPIPSVPDDGTAPHPAPGDTARTPTPDSASPAATPGGTSPSTSVPDPAEAAALAAAFAVDLLSWDEDDPVRRARALGAHLASPAGAALLGWTGTGRQRADLVLPGRVRIEPGRAHVDLRVRFVPYRRVDARAAGAPEPEPDSPLGEPAAAPAPSARGWRGLAARWVRIEVTVLADGDRLVVDAGPVPQAPTSGSPGGPR